MPSTVAQRLPNTGGRVSVQAAVLQGSNQSKIHGQKQRQHLQGHSTTPCLALGEVKKTLPPVHLATSLMNPMEHMLTHLRN